MSVYAQALAVAIEAAQAAGAVLRQEFYRPGGPRGHGAHADIDAEAEHLIRGRLLAAFPWNYLGEELQHTANNDPHHRWLVDPNDGTSAYLKGWRGSAVSIAALRDGVPVLGVVYAYCYPDGKGDLFAWAEGCPLTRNGVELKSDLCAAALSGVVFLSQDADDNAAANSALVHPARYIALPSIAYRLARVAAGDGVAAVSLSFPCCWDYAAGHALLRAAGGILVNGHGEEVKYAADGSSSCRECFGGSPAAVRELCRRDWLSALDSSTPAAPPFALVKPQRGRVCTDDGRLSRAQGCLLGQLAGDALGGLVEFTPLETIRARYPDGCRDLKDGGSWDNLAGQPTDDSEMALTLARVMVHTGRYDRGAVLDGYVRWWVDPHTWDRGGTIRIALSNAARGATTEERLRLDEQYADPDRPTNGSLMRISPLGIFAAGRSEQAAEWARQDSSLTHPNPLSRDSCAVYVAAIASAIANGGSPEDCFRAALAEAERSSVQPEVRAVLEAARAFPPSDYRTNQGYVLIALQNAFYQLLHARSLEDGIIDTVMRGGDTDTTSAIAGALLGAAHGRPAMPERWLRALLSCRPLSGTPTAHPRTPEYWPVDALELAEALLCAGAASGGR
jgi:ADP-ribosylglycohydrolase/fructose-1,6-bisphosphatase/inositol monophosphatase family enzyme